LHFAQKPRNKSLFFRKMAPVNFLGIYDVIVILSKTGLFVENLDNQCVQTTELCKELARAVVLNLF
jgi:hypothetical protein